MFETILVPTDGSPAACRALEFACGIANAFNSKIVLVNVIDHRPPPESLRHMAEIEHLIKVPGTRTGDIPLSDAPVPGVPATDGYDARLSIVISERIVEHAKSMVMGNGVDAVDGFVDDGDPAECILSRAETASASLIVMGARGLSELKALLIGSVSHKICQLSEIPCVTVK